MTRLDAAEVNGLNGPAGPTAGEESVATRFARIAERHPDRTAVDAPDAEWTYAELDLRATGLAVRILERLGGSSEPVALLMDHSAPLIAAILAILKTGKTYLALDPAHPGPRLASMLSDSGARLLVTDRANKELAGSLASGTFPILEYEEGLVGVSTPTLPETSPDTAAWLMYTSGSTGNPKGVWQNHRGIVHHSDVYRDLIQLTPDDRLSLVTSCSLATSGTPMFSALLNGAALCLFHVRSQGAERLAAWLRARRISVYHSVPTVFRQLARSAGAEQAFEHARLIRLGGEPVLRSDVELYRRLSPAHCRLMHSLSSTETGLVSALMIDKQTDLPALRVPVGRAAGDVELSLVDEQGHAAREGRIAVHSAYLGQGYWNQPELTAERFQPDPANPGRRLFISSDLGRFLPDGSLEHLGRVDRVVKIRGLRADLTEVEAALHATDLFKDAVVAAPEDESGNRRLTAYIVPRAAEEISLQTCRRALRSALPEHLLPSEIISLNRLPQTPGGKVDWRALPAPEGRPTLLPTSEEPLPKAGVESNLARIWESVLGVSPIGRFDDFYDLGGTSLQSGEILSRVEDRFGVVLPPSILAEHSTVQDLAMVIADQTVKPSSSSLVTLRAGGSGRPLFLIHSGQGDVAGYGQLVRRLEDRPIYGFQAPGLDGARLPLTSIPALARHYLRSVMAVQPEGPYLLGGTCMGGLVAMEMAQQLQRHNRSVGLLAVFDYNPRRFKGRFKLAIKTVTDGVRDNFRKLRWSIVRISGGKRWLPRYRRFVIQSLRSAVFRHTPSVYPGTLTLFLTADKPERREDRRLTLTRFARDTRVVQLPGDRRGLFAAPLVDELAGELQAILEQVESPAPGRGNRD